MKSYLQVAVCVVSVVFYSCSNTAPDTDVPKQIVLASNGIMTGKIVLKNFFEPNWQDINMGGVLVQLEGTSKSTVSDSSGSWVISAIDSGVYNLRFTKNGYDTFRLENVATNGADSNAIRYRYTSNSLSFDYPSVFLTELEPTVQVSSKSASMSEKIVGKDSLYFLSADVVVTVSHPNAYYETRVPMEVGCYLSLRNTVSIDEMTPDSSGNIMAPWICLGDINDVSERGNQRTFAIRSMPLKNTLGIRKGDVLYLHFRPRYEYRAREIVVYRNTDIFPSFPVKSKFISVATASVTWQ